MLINGCIPIPQTVQNRTNLGNYMSAYLIGSDEFANSIIHVFKLSKVYEKVFYFIILQFYLNIDKKVKVV